MIFDFTILRPRLDGMGIYSKNIFERLNDMIQDGTLLINRKFANDNPDVCRGRKVKLIRKVLLHRCSPGLYLSSTSKELYYSPTHHGPIFYRRKIITIHDLIPLLIPTKSIKQFVYQLIFMRLSVKFCRHIITDAILTKTLIEKHLGVPGRKISVIVPGTDVEKTVPKPITDLVCKKYFLMVGVNSEYKNYRRVLEAYRRIGNTEIGMVITSNDPVIAEYCSKFAGVEVRRYLDLDELVFLYKSAMALVTPSLMEGFGLPALEAARLRVPIITSKGSTMEEFLGAGNAIYVQPESDNQIETAMRTVMHGDYPEHLRTQAYEATASFTWEGTASKVKQLLQNELSTL